MTGPADSQRDAVDYLGSSASYGEAVDRVDRIDTHGALVFLAGDRVFKIKRAVTLPYLDFSTLARRKAALTRELELNRRTAPQIYLGLAALRRDGAGGLSLAEAGAVPEAEGDVVEWVLVMRRFPQAARLDRVAARGGMTVSLSEALADAVRRFHDETGPASQAATPLSQVSAENLAELRQRPDLFPADQVGAYDGAISAALQAAEPLLQQRAAAGCVRRLHGDLHLGNICVLAGRPVIFDALEFDEALGTIDQLYDLAFLLMDLEQRGHREAANLVLNCYLRDPQDLAGLAALPLFLSCRAAVRAKVAAAAEASQNDSQKRADKRREAGHYFAAATDYLRPMPARLIAVGGLSGSGKSALARAWAPRIGAAPGAVVLRSDVIRKRLFGQSETVRLRADAYAPEVTARVYESLAKQAEIALAAGRTVIADAVFAREEERAAIAAAAARAGRPFAGFWLTAPLDVRLARVGARRGDASDATVDVAQRQETYDTGPMTWQLLPAAEPLDSLVARASAAAGYD